MEVTKEPLTIVTHEERLEAGTLTEQLTEKEEKESGVLKKLK